MTARKRSPVGSPGDLAGALAERLPSLLVDARGRVIAVGRLAIVDLGVRPEALIGRPFDDAFRPARKSARSAAPEERGGRGERGERIFGAGDDGAAKHVEAVEVPVGDGNRWIYLIDRTDRHRLRAECLHLGQLAAAGRLISGIVHEINNPLSGIIGYAQLLLMRDLDRETRSALEMIHSEALRTSRIVRNLLDFSRRRPTIEASASLPSVLRKALELKAHDLRVHNVTVQLDLSKQLPAVRADPGQLLQVFVNLIANAEQAMYESDRGGRITIAATATRDRVTVRVTDTGPGVPDAHRERIFEPFFTTKNEGKGTGLGLGLCREILHRLGGSLHLGETSRSGATFALTLPAALAAEPAPAKRVRRSGNRYVAGRRLLVVEDDPVCRSLVTEAFESTGNEVHAFDRSASALKFLRSRWVDAVITDLHRPGSNGIEFHEQVRRIDAQLAKRVLFLTGDTLNQDLARFVARVGVPVLEKPVQIDELHAAVQKLLASPARRTKAVVTGES